MKRESVLRNNVFLFGSEAAARVLAFLLFAVAARWLGPRDLGRYTFAVGFAELLKLFLDLGTHPLLVREVAASPPKLAGQLRVTLRAKGLLVLGVLAIVVLVGSATGYRPDMRPVVAVALVAMVLNSYAELWQAVFKGLERMSLVALARFAHAAVRVGVGVIVVVAGGGLAGLITVYLGSAFFHMLFSFSLAQPVVRRHSSRGDPLHLAELVAEAAPLSLVVIFVTLYSSLGRVFIHFMRTDAEVAWYDAAYRFVGSLGVVASVISQVALPAMSRLWRRDSTGFSQVVEKSFKFLVSLALPLGVGGTLLSAELVRFIYGGEYDPSSTALAILVWAVAAIFTSSVFYHLLIATRRQRLLAILTGVGALGNVLLNLVVVPRWGFIGASANGLITEAGVLAGVLIASRHAVRLGRLAAFLPRPLVGCLLVAGACLTLRGVHPLVAMVVAAALYVGFLFASGHIEKDEVAAVTRLIRELRR
jgi:O-antigen/teichoic acid export membrane protein